MNRVLKLNLTPCRPPIWASTGHSQTIWGHVIPSPLLRVRGETITVPLPDGDVMIGEHIVGRVPSAICLFHGLSGSADSDYMQRTAQVAIDLGCHVFLFNHRGCGAGAGLARRPYHSGRAEDISSAIAKARERVPQALIGALGFSLSGNALLLLLSAHQNLPQPDFAISVNAPIDLESAAHKLKVGLNRIYDFRFVRRCTEEVQARRRADPSLPNYRIPRLTTLHDFDNIYTAPAAGFKNREEYYELCSTKHRLDAICAPTLLLTAADDPIVDVKNYSEAKLSATTTLHIEKFGGHMGYYSQSKTPLGSHRWLDYALKEALASGLHG